MRTILRTILTLIGAALLSSSLAAQTLPVAAIGASAASPMRPAAQPKTYGTTQPSYYVIDASELSPLASANQYGAINNAQLRYLTNLAGLGFMGPVHLPAGAHVSSIEIDYFDNSASGEIQASFAVCDSNGQTCAFALGNPGCDDAPVTVCSGNPQAPGYFSRAEDLSDDGITIDDLLHRYFVFAGNTTNDGSTAISQIRIAYFLQVSPPPATATFNDVPTSDPAFQFIEAVAAAGVTSGCGGGNYCPDSFITRRQMAVFLAKALGLQWN